MEKCNKHFEIWAFILCVHVCVCVCLCVSVCMWAFLLMFTKLMHTTHVLIDIMPSGYGIALYIHIYTFCIVVCWEFLLHIWLIDETLTSTIIPGQSGPGSNGQEWVTHPSQSSNTGASPSDTVIPKTLLLRRRGQPCEGVTVSIF